MNLNFSDGVWQEIERWAHEKRQREREKNDSTEMDALQTAMTRGRISVFKELIRLPKLQEARSNGDAPE